MVTSPLMFYRLHLHGTPGHGVGGNPLGPDLGLLQVQLQLVPGALAPQLPGERLDAIGRQRQGVDTGWWFKTLKSLICIWSLI